MGDIYIVILTDYQTKNSILGSIYISKDCSPSELGYLESRFVELVLCI